MSSGAPSCLQCGRPARLGARFCGSCGALLSATTIAVRTLVLPAEPASAPVAEPTSGLPARGELIPGTSLGSGQRYRITRSLGAGGFGEAYLAHDTQLDRTCVVKRLALNPAWRREERQVALANFQREARLLVSLNTPGHPNIPEIYEYLPDSHCLVMKHVVGEDLVQLVRRRGGRLPENEALRYVRDVCSALVYMHSRTPEPAIHRDIKPANILLDAEERIWLIDFGLSKSVQSLASAVATRQTIAQSQMAGTLGYTPPEQWRGQSEPRSDIYALAATLHTLLTGYRAPESQLLAMIRGEAALPPVRQLIPEVRPEVERLIERALVVDVAARPTAQQFLAELDALLSQPDIPPPPAPARPPEVASFVGRAAELAAYQQRLEREHLAVITGIAGVGKTALAAMLARQLVDPEQLFWHTFHPDEGADGFSWALAGYLAHQGRDEAWRMLQSARLSGGQPPPAEMLFDYLVGLLRDQGAASSAPPLLCLDDLHQAEDAPLVRQLGKRLAREALAGRLTLIVTSRTIPTFAPAGIVPLGGLGQAAARDFLASRDVFLADDLTASLVRYTGGNVQLLNLASAALRRADDPAAVIARLVESDDIERYLLREVDAGLSEAERAVMGAVAALLGYGGTRDAVEALLDDGSVKRVLSDLCARSLLTVSEGSAGKEYGQHAIIQAFFYDQLSRRERQALHRRAASYYETDEPDTLKAARHYERAGEFARAATLATGDIWALINQGQARALQALLAQFTPNQLDGDLWVAVKLARGEVAALLGEREAARQHYHEALDRLASMPDTPAARELEARLCNGMGRLLEYDSPNQALEWLRRGLERLSGANATLEAALHISIGTALIGSGAYDVALEPLDRGLALLPAGANQLRISALINLARIYSARSDIERSNAMIGQALELARQSNDSFRMLNILNNMGVERYIAGDWASGIASFQDALELAERLSSQTQRITLELNLATAFSKTGDYEAAQRYFSSGLELAAASNLRVFAVSGQASLADLHIRQGAWEAAASALRAAEQLALEIDAREQLAEIARGWAQVRLGLGATEAALEQAERAVRLANELGAGLEAGVGLRVLGQVLFATGRHDEAMAAFAQSLELLDGQDPYEAARTRAVWGAALRGTDAAQSAALLEAARATFESLGARPDLAAVERIIRD